MLQSPPPAKGAERALALARIYVRNCILGFGYGDDGRISPCEVCPIDLAILTDITGLSGRALILFVNSVADEFSQVRRQTNVRSRKRRCRALDQTIVETQPKARHHTPEHRQKIAESVKATIRQKRQVAA